jgi:hypothetical protein
MIAPSDWISPTRVVGMATHLLTAIVCGGAWARNQENCRASRLAPCLAMLEAFLFLDAAFNWRWILHGMLMNAAVANGVYGQRKLPQVLALLIVASLPFCAMIMAFQRLQGRIGAIFAIFGGVFSAAFWMVELISLHATDIALQARLGPVMLIAVVWVLTSATTAAGIYWDARKPRGNFESNS